MLFRSLSVVAPARQNRISLPETSPRPASVHEYVAAHARTLPGFSPRPAFGCRSGAAEQDLIARNFTAPLLRCMNLSRYTPERCPIFHRGPAFGCRSGAAEQNLIARNFTAPCFRLSLRRGRTGSHCPELRRALPLVHDKARPKSLKLWEDY